MKTQVVYLTFAMGILSLPISGQSRLPGYKDTSQTITRDELILERTRLSKEREAKRQNSKIARQKTRDSIAPSIQSRKIYKEREQNAPKNASGHRKTDN